MLVYKVTTGFKGLI